ncbi:hypothetical protein GCM10025867_44430 [Frondihabitans sucicola]|uniref:HTH araC/xylS-type domain-containing protein n=1 Tax=Frondihabitans sucicola TaxID=1268041 RepID=A0ABN6Y7S3_9MICO|nr:helix-turn-helix domain-containing protein [Frondihabitans sucicola]BDZ52202.1 hypothetical protein GCM10025867_44430 [Frondihabitans sucicola]
MDEAIELYTTGYNGAGLHLTKTESSFSYRYTAKGDQDVTLRTSQLNASIRGTVQPEGEYVVAWLTSGRGVMDIGRDELSVGVGQPSMFPTGRRYAFRFDDATQNLVQFSGPYLERLAAERIGAETARLHFNHAELPDPTALRRWRDTIAGVAGSILGNTTGSLLRAEANALAANALLDTFSFDGPRRGVLLLPPSSGRLATAIDYIHANPEQPLTTTGIAEVAGLSLRGLQHAFSRQLGMTPTEYLRGVRLDQVRDELLEAAPTETTVAAVARRWGFSHSGRFSSAYVARFAEYPAETLRR